MHDDLSIRVGVEVVSPTLKFLSQFRKVVNLAVIDDPNTLVFVVNGLVTATNINDAQPSHAQAHRAASIDPLVVGTTVNNGLAHLPNLRSVDLLASASNHAGYPTHRATSD